MCQTNERTAETLEVPKPAPAPGDVLCRSQTCTGPGTTQALPVPGVFGALVTALGVAPAGVAVLPVPGLLPPHQLPPRALGAHGFFIKAQPLSFHFGR